MKKLGILFVILLFLMSCNTNNEGTNTSVTVNNDRINTLKSEIEAFTIQESELLKEVDKLKGELTTYALTLQEKDKALQEKDQYINDMKSSSMTLLETAATVVDLIKNQDMTGLSTYVDTTLGLRFSPYSYINVTSDLVFTDLQVSNLMTDQTLYNWGFYDGSGDPIQMNFLDYYNAFVYDQDFVNPHMIGNNVIIGSGNMINNLGLVYPNASFVEFHFSGFNPAYAGMDWVSLRLIFKNISGSWKLIGIGHDQWTS